MQKCTRSHYLRSSYLYDIKVRHVCAKLLGRMLTALEPMMWDRLNETSRSLIKAGLLQV